MTTINVTARNHRYAPGDHIIITRASFKLMARVTLWRVTACDRDRFTAIKLGFVASLCAHVRLFCDPEIRRICGWFR